MIDDQSMPLISSYHLPRLRVSRRRRGRMGTLLVLSLICSLLLLPFYVVYKPPNILIRYMQYKWPEIIFQVSTTKKIVALTIDDAPTEYTREILALLSEYNATATFFIIGSQVEGRIDIMKAMIEQGSELGNHGMHDEPARDLSNENLAAQIKQVDVMIEAAYDSAGRSRTNHFYRPGSGFFSRRMVDLMRTLDYRLVLGGIYPHDPQIPYWRLNARHILSMVRPGGIIICHDRRSWTLPMLRRVLPELQRRGYSVVSLSRLLQYAS